MIYGEQEQSKVPFNFKLESGTVPSLPARP